MSLDTPREYQNWLFIFHHYWTEMHSCFGAYLLAITQREHNHHTVTGYMFCTRRHLQVHVRQSHEHSIHVAIWTIAMIWYYRGRLLQQRWSSCVWLQNNSSIIWVSINRLLEKTACFQPHELYMYPTLSSDASAGFVQDACSPKTHIHTLGHEGLNMYPATYCD